MRSLRILASLASAAALIACTAPSNDDHDTSEDDLLPNGSIFERGHDGSGYKTIADVFKARGLDMKVNLDGFAPSWPLADDKTTVLTRVGTPLYLGSYGYYHTALDVMREAPEESNEVVAPVDGLALVFDWSGNRTNPANKYAGVVAIYDPVSHVVIQMMHVNPTDALGNAAEPVQVRKGEVVGRIAPPPIDAAHSERLAHTHVGFIDGERSVILNPAALIPGYHDTTKPTVKGVYLTDENAQVKRELVSGKLDLVAETFDRDDDSKRNLEVTAVAFSVRDQDGNVLAQQPRCELIHTIESLIDTSTYRAKDLVDFGSAASQLGGGWPSSDIDNPERTFRFALSQVHVVEGRCLVKSDAEGFLEIGDAVRKIDVEVTVWDPKGNEASERFSLERGAPAPDGGAPPPPANDGGTDAPAD